MKQRISLFILLLVAIIGNAQNPGHYVRVDVGGGLEMLQYKAIESNGIGGKWLVDFNYNCFLTPNWGIGTGVGISAFRTTTTLNNYMATVSAFDMENNLNYEHRTYYNDWKEMQQAFTVDIPIMALYQSRIAQNFNLLVGLGAKIHIPLNNTYQIKEDGTIETRGYYKVHEVEYANIPQHGFTTWHNVPNGEKGTFKMKVYPSVCFDLGANYRFSELSNQKYTTACDLYFGLYADYGITNIVEAQNIPLLSQGGDYSGMLNSADVAKNVQPFSVGVKIGITFSFEKDQMRWIWW